MHFYIGKSDVTWRDETCRACRAARRNTSATTSRSASAALTPSQQTAEQMFYYERLFNCVVSWFMLKSLLFSYRRQKRYRRGSEWKESKSNRKITEENDNNWQWACWDMSPTRTTLSCLSWRDVTDKVAFGLKSGNRSVATAPIPPQLEGPQEQQDKKFIDETK